MNIISIGTDRTIFQEGSRARERMVEYGTLFTELHIIVFAKKSLNLTQQQIADNVWIYPTHSYNKLFYIFDAIKIAKKIISHKRLSEDSTVVTTQDPFETGLVGYHLKKKYHLPLQMQLHTDIASLYFKSSSFLNKIRLFIAKRILPTADEIRVVSQYIKKSVSENFSIQDEKIDVLPIFVDVKKFNKEQPKKKTWPFSVTILMASRLTPEKNISFALEVFKKVQEKHPASGLVIVGSGSEEHGLKQKVKKLGIAQSVVFEPWAYDLMPYYASANIFLLTSVFEGYGMTLIEAALMELPIVTSRVGIAQDVLIHEKNALIYDIHDTDSCMKHLAMLVEDLPLRNRLGQQVKQDILEVLPKDRSAYLEMYKQYLEKTI